MTFKWTRINTVELQNDKKKKKKKSEIKKYFFLEEDLVDLVSQTDLTDYESDRLVLALNTYWLSDSS